MKAIDMKEMVYSKEGKTELLFSKEFGDFHVAVINMRGSHPCGYVKVPDDIWESMANEHKKGELAKYELYNTFDEHFSAHGGFTYSCKYGHPGGPSDLPDGNWVGWDYAHAGDFTAFDLCFSQNPGKKWTTLEIVDEALDVCNQMIEYRKENLK